MKEALIPIQKFCDYLRVIEADYKDDNSYHNAIQTADVKQGVHALIQMVDRDDFHPTEEELLAMLLGAVVHDVKHPG